MREGADHAVVSNVESSCEAFVTNAPRAGSAGEAAPPCTTSVAADHAPPESVASARLLAPMASRAAVDEHEPPSTVGVPVSPAGVPVSAMALSTAAPPSTPVDESCEVLV